MRRLNRIWTSSKCDSLDCKLRGSDNENGDPPFIAPMKSEHLKAMISENKQRIGVALFFLVCLTLFVLTPGAAQLREQRHVTAIQLGGAAEGSRVTIGSDSPLLDYEAFRRGDRFYVKIPLADLSSAAPHFRADGFEDVQVQRAGDSLIVSFKLQPGATARVDQRGNHLDVIFSAPNRSNNNAATSGSMRAGNPQVSVDRGRDTAGPAPQDAGSASRERFAAERGSVNESRRPGDPRWPAITRRPDANKNSNKAGNSQLTTNNKATASPSPRSTPSSLMSPKPSISYQPITATTPAASSSVSPVSGTSASGSLNWGARWDVARRWMSANRLATLLGALILLSLIVYLVAGIRRRRETVVKTQRAKTPKVQPKYSPDNELNELSNAGTSDETHSREAAAEKASKQSAAAAAAQSSSRILTRPTIVSTTSSDNEQSSEEEEREVFEL